MSEFTKKTIQLTKMFCSLLSVYFGSVNKELQKTLWTLFFLGEKLLKERLSLYGNISFHILNSVSYYFCNFDGGPTPNFSFARHRLKNSTWLGFRRKIKTHLLLIGWPFLCYHKKGKKRNFVKSVLDLSMDAIVDVFCPNRECRLVGTQKKCGYQRRNSNQEETYKCWHCSAKVKDVNVFLAIAAIQFDLRNWSSKFWTIDTD